MSVLGRFILWDFPRASWQYDVIVALIVAFIFLTPREFFKDQPKASSVVMLPAEHGGNAFWIEPELLAGVPESERLAKASALVKARFKGKQGIARLEPILDSEKEIRGYLAFPSQ